LRGGYYLTSCPVFMGPVLGARGSGWGLRVKVVCSEWCVVDCSVCIVKRGECCARLHVI